MSDTVELQGVSSSDIFDTGGKLNHPLIVIYIMHLIIKIEERQAAPVKSNTPSARTICSSLSLHVPVWQESIKQTVWRLKPLGYGKSYYYSNCTSELQRWVEVLSLCDTSHTYGPTRLAYLEVGETEAPWRNLNEESSVIVLGTFFLWSLSQTTLQSSLEMLWIIDGWMDGCMDGWMDGWMNNKMQEQWWTLPQLL